MDLLAAQPDRIARLSLSLRSHASRLSERDLLCLSLFGAWAVFTAMIFLESNALFYDERWFLRETQGVPLGEVFNKGAHLGYGQAFWLVLSGVPSVLALRVIWLGMFLATPLLIAMAAPRQVRILVLATWLVMPVAWWYAKILGPEIPNLFLCAVTVALVQRGKLAWAGFAFGMAIGVKFIALPIAAIFLWRLIEDWRTSFRKLGAAAALTPLGFVAANPIALLDPIQVFDQIRGASGAGNWDVSKLGDVLSNRTLLWDVIPAGGLAEFIMPLSLLIMLGGLAWMMEVPRALLAAACAGLIASLAFFLIPSRFLGWYWLPYIPVILAVIAAGTKAPRLATPFLALTFVTNLPASIGNIKPKLEQLSIVRNSAGFSGCLAEALKGEQVGNVLDRGEFSGLTLPPIPGRYIDDFYLHEGEWSHIFLGQRMLEAYPSRAAFQLDGLTLVRDCGGIMVFRRHPAAS